MLPPKLLVFLLCLLVTSVCSAQQPPVHRPLVLPSAKAPNQWFYCDPVKGNTKTGDGSIGKPWGTLKEVFSAKYVSGDNPKVGKVHAGDGLALMSGNHGELIISSGANTDFITVQAALNQAPLISKLQLNKGSSCWRFIGITFQSEKLPVPLYNILVRATCDKFIFIGNTVQSASDGSGWSPDKWMPDSSGMMFASSGVVYAGNGAIFQNNQCKFVLGGFNIGGTGIDSRNILMDSNRIEYFPNDGVTYSGSDLVFTNNTIVDHLGAVKNGSHSDAIQCFPLAGVTARQSNLYFKGNTIAEGTGFYAQIPLRPTGISPMILQGFMLNEGSGYEDLTFEDNDIDTSSYHQLSVYGGHRVRIANNRARSSPKTTNIGYIGVYYNKAGSEPSSDVWFGGNSAQSFRLESPGIFKYPGNTVTKVVAY